MILKDESIKHQNLVRELISKFESEYNYEVQAADLEDWEDKPRLVKNNNKKGDGEDKQPDLDGFNEKEERYIRGEAKTGDNDINTQHSITQYLLFSNLSNPKNGKPSLFYIIVPARKKQELNTIITENVPSESWENIRMISSCKYDE